MARDEVDSGGSVAPVFVAVGGNIAPERNVFQGVERLHALTPVHAVSGVYWTPAIGRPEQPNYLNCVVEVAWAGTPVSLRDGVLRNVERMQGRTRCSDKFAARELDLDILVFGDWVYSRDGLVVPDPDIGDRAFLLRGLLDLNPSFVLPDIGATVEELACGRADVAAFSPDCECEKRLRTTLGL